MSVSEIARNTQKRTNPKDIFYTPKALVEAHLNIIKNLKNSNDKKILDPFFGKGIYYNLFNQYFPGCEYDFTEIELNKDFFKYNEKTDIIVSNPPYSMIDEVLEHSIKLKPRIISYLIAFHNLTPKRIEYMNKEGYYLINIYMSKVHSWFGMSLICTFEKSENKRNCIDFDRIVYKIK